VQALAPLCAQLQQDATMRVMLSLFMPELSLASQAIKLQYNAGGLVVAAVPELCNACYPMRAVFLSRPGQPPALLRLLPSRRAVMR
jgi:hypothetical protein